MTPSDHWTFSIVGGQLHAACSHDVRKLPVEGMSTWIEGTCLMIGRKKPRCVYSFRYDFESDAKLNRDKVDTLLSGAQK